MKVVHVLVCLHICADYAHMTKTSSGSVSMETEWELFKDTYNKSYSDNEDGYRFSLWKNNLKTIFQHNSEADAGIHTYRLAMNQLGDMTEEELSHLHGLRVNSVNDTVARDSTTTVVPSDDVTLPDEIDWRKHGYVTPVKSQGHCGACYTFAATGALEGQHFRKTGKLISLSEQNLLDCSATYGNKGCVGGLMDNAYKYIIHNRGVDTEKDYPYKAEVEKCKYKLRERGATCKGFRDLPKGNEKALLSAVGGIGPVSVGIDATSFTFFFYSGGVYDNIWCSSEKLSHGVLVVGYGRENGQDYWLVKNSWGQDWGVKGYIKMARNKNNQCGIATLASYPIV